MPFSPEVKSRMFARCMRHCCLCRKQCGTNIEAAHIIDEAAGGMNDEENGIPLCFDCHQEIGAYRDSHPKGNKSNEPLAVHGSACRVRPPCGADSGRRSSENRPQ